MVFRNIILCSLLVALVAGAAFSIYQHRMVTPIILAAEKYEIVDMGHHSRLSQTKEKEAWGPEEGVERTGFTFGTNFLVAFGFSILLVSGMTYTGKGNMIRGVLWGCAGYLVFFIAPGLGLSPEIPGMEAADLEWRQGWWLMTVVMTATGLVLLVFGDGFLKFSGVGFLLIPHMIGAPVAEMHGFAHPDENVVHILENLWHRFMLQTYIANALLWIIMGLLSGVLAARMVDRLDKTVNN